MESQFEFVLKNSKLLKNIDTSKFNFDQIKGSLLTINEGEIVYREGNPSDSVYIIVSGEINLLKKKVLGSTKSSVFYDEDAFGYEEIFEGTSRTGTAVALRDTYLIRLSKYEFESLLNQDRKILDELKTSIETQPELLQEEKVLEEEKETNIQENDSVDDVTFLPEEEPHVEEKTLESNEHEVFETIALDESKTEEVNNLENADETIFPPEEELPHVEEKEYEAGKDETFEKISLDKSETEESSEVIEDETDALLKELQNIKDDDEYPTEIDLTDISEDEKKEFEKEEESFDDESIIETAFETEFNELKESEPEISKEDQEFLDKLSSSNDAFYENKNDDSEVKQRDVSLEDEVELKGEAPVDLEYNLEPKETDDDAPIDFEEGSDVNVFMETGNEEEQESLSEKELPLQEEPIGNFDDDKEQLENFLAEAQNFSNFESNIEDPNDQQNQESVENYDSDNEEINNIDKKEAPDESANVMTAEVLETINQAAQLVNSNIKLDDALVSIVDVACNLTNADRGTLYLVDSENEQLWSKIAMGDDLKEIRLNIGEGIAGWVGKSGETVNIKNVQEDERFKSDFDKSSGYLTKTMLCFPIKNKKEDIIGVLQLLNSTKGEFTSLDEQILSGLSIHAALALENAYLVEKLLQTERVTSLGKMANFLIQDIKKPILVSKRYAEHLKTKEEFQKNSQVIDMLLEQLSNVADMVQTTSSYYEGKSALHAANTNFNDILEDLIVKIDSLVKLKNCSIEKNLETDVNVKIDFKDFSQCFNHIVRNACEAMPEGGVVYITSKKDEDNVILSIKDTGLGIPDSLKEKIFEPFMSHGKKEGTGLGLSITKKIIEDHGGTIRVESELGEGADFIITFPATSLY